MRLVALTVLIVGNLFANQVLAEDVSTQPLTRVDCDKAEMAWDENANVCGSDWGNFSVQPLTRDDCDKAGMAWNDTANVCGEASQATEARPEVQVAQPESEVTDSAGRPLAREDSIQSASKETNPIVSTVLINIDKGSQMMTVFLDGAQQYEWPVSTGRPGYSTPSGTYTTRSMNKIWYSRQWDNAPMFHAIFFTKKGHAIHGTLEERNLGKAASHGCVRISRKNAETLFALVEQNGLENTQVVLTGTTLGGEGKVASPARSKSRYGRVARGSEGLYAKPRRGGFFRRLFGGL